VIQCLLGKLVVALDREDNWAGRFRMGMLGRATFQPAHEGSGLGLESEAQKSINRKGSIANPGVPVVPVASASDDFRQTRSGGCNDRSGRFKGKKLQRQGRSVYLIPPPPVVGAGGEPVLPEFHSPRSNSSASSSDGGQGAPPSLQSSLRMKICDFPSESTNSADTPPRPSFINGTAVDRTKLKPADLNVAPLVPTSVSCVCRP